MRMRECTMSAKESALECPHAPPAGTAGSDPPHTESAPATTPARGSVSAEKRTPSFRPPFRRLSTPSSKVHSAFKSPLRTPSTSTAPSPECSTAPPQSGGDGRRSAPRALKAAPASTGLTSSARHKPYSLTPSRTRCPHRSTEAVPETEESVKAEIARFREQIEAVETEIEELSRDCSEDELQQYIDHLHQYNEAKDAGQLLLGKLAEVRGTTVSELYQEFDLSLDD